MNTVAYNQTLMEVGPQCSDQDISFLFLESDSDKSGPTFCLNSLFQPTHSTFELWMGVVGFWPLWGGGGFEHC